MARASGLSTVSVVRRAVTLIEILVVVAIIALLIAILMPGLAKGREQSRAVVCQSNQRQCLLGVLNSESPLRQKVRNNFGWVVPALRKSPMEPRIFTCPSDPDPKPIPVVWAKLHSIDRKYCAPLEPDPAIPPEEIVNNVNCCRPPEGRSSGTSPCDPR